MQSFDPSTDRRGPASPTGHIAKPLAVDDVSVPYGPTIALHHFSFSVRAGEFISVPGPPGCGKSTLLRVIAGRYPIVSGPVMIGDRPVTKLHPKDRGVAFVFQSYALYPQMTCRDNLTTR